MQKMFSLYQLEVFIGIEKAEDHQYQGRLIHLLQSAVEADPMSSIKYSAGIHNLPPINIRDLLEFRKSKDVINIDEVEPIGNFKEIWKRKHVTRGFISRSA